MSQNKSALWKNPKTLKKINQAKKAYQNKVHGNKKQKKPNVKCFEQKGLDDYED